MYNINRTCSEKNTKPVHSLQARLLYISFGLQSVFSWEMATLKVCFLPQTHRGVGTHVPGGRGGCMACLPGWAPGKD